jgi:F-type H+-transporting ATPase subunit epsilon
MQFDLVSPERQLASVEATFVMLAGTEGDMTVMADHAPVITTLRPGIVTVEASGNTQMYAVTGGFAEVTPAGVSVLAETAVATTDAKSAMFDDLIASARDIAAKATGEMKDDADKYVADLEALKAATGH